MPNINFIYVKVYSVNNGSHVVGNFCQEVASSSDARADYGNRLINSLLNVPLDLQKRLFALTHFQYYITFHEYGDVM